MSFTQECHDVLRMFCVPAAVEGSSHGTVGWNHKAHHKKRNYESIVSASQTIQDSRIRSSGATLLLHECCREFSCLLRGASCKRKFRRSHRKNFLVMKAFVLPSLQRQQQSTFSFFVTIFTYKNYIELLVMDCFQSLKAYHHL